MRPIEAGGGGALRLVTLCGSTKSRFDAMQDAEEILHAHYRTRGIDVRSVDLGDWSLGAVPRLLAAIDHERPDVVLMQYPTRAFGASLGPIALGALLRTAPLVVQLHEFVAAHPLRKLALAPLLARATLIGVTADREAAALLRWYPWLRRKLRSIPIASNIPGRSWAPSSSPVVTYFGQIRPEKGLETFLACQEKLGATRPEIRFELIGAAVPKWADYAARTIALARSRGVVVAEAQDGAAVADRLREATVALLPFPDGASFRRGSLFAAAGCGVPLVTTTGADTPAELDGLLDAAAVDDIAGLVALVERVLDDRPARAAAHARSVALSARFGWDQAVDRYLATVREAADMWTRPNNATARPGRARAGIANP